MIGDQRPFMSALVVLDPDTAPAWAQQHGIEATSLAELADHAEVRAEVDREVEASMASFNNAERVKKVIVLHDEWLPDSEELTPDEQAQAPRHPRQVRRGDRVDLRPLTASVGIRRSDGRAPVDYWAIGPVAERHGDGLLGAVAGVGDLHVVARLVRGDRPSAGRPSVVTACRRRR